MSSDGAFKHESLQDAATIQEYLEILRQGFASGTLRMRVGERELVLEPKDMIEFTVEAKRKDDRCKLSFKFSWKEGEKDSPKEEHLTMEAE